MAELLDIYDENLRHLGVKERGAVHRDGDWHRVFHCWVLYRDADGCDWMVAQKRGPDKDIFPDRLDVSVGGHYAAGESIVAGVREAREELGLDVAFDDLIPVGLRITVARYEGLIDREFAENFLLICDRDIRDYRYQKEEVAGLVAFAIDDGLALFAGERESITVRAAGLGADVLEIGVDDFVSVVDRPFYKALVVAKRCLNGEKYLVL